MEFAEKMANVGKIVIVAALDGTFQRVGFGDILRLIPLAESVVKLKAVCMACFNDASFTKRTTLEKEVIVEFYAMFFWSLLVSNLIINFVFQLEIIGGEDMYMAVCRNCHHSSSTLTPSKFPLSEVTNSNRRQIVSNGSESQKVKRDLSKHLNLDVMDVEN